MDTYQKESVFSAPRRNHLHHIYIKIMLHDYAHTPREVPADSHLAYGTRARSARGSENYAIVSIIRPFTGKGALGLSVNNVVVYLSCRKDAIEVCFREVTQINAL